MKTEYVMLDGGDGDAEKIIAAAAIIEKGGLVAFPTETVYGIACAATNAAINRLDEVKGRSPDKRYTLHIGNIDQLDRYVSNVNLRGRKLIDNAWPGPLTIVLSPGDSEMASKKNALGDEAFSLLYKDGTIGLRCPDNSIAVSLLSTVSVPVVAPSANMSGNQPAVTADEVMAEFDGKIDMVLAPSKDIAKAQKLNQLCKYAKSSTVVRLDKVNIEVLREGVIDENTILEMSSVGIMFVCTGNTCRSPMAELFCKQYLAEKLNCDVDELDKKGYKICSAGVASCPGMHASDQVINVCTQRNIDATGHLSSVFDCQEAKKCDFIFAMTESHRGFIIDRCPEVENKCMLLDSHGGICDPFGGNERIYQQCAKSIEIALNKRLDEVL